MDHVSAFVMGLSFIIIATMCIIIYFNNQKTTDQLNAALTDIVKQFNDNQFDAFKFDKKQQQDIQNLRSRVDEIKTTQTDLNNNIQNKYQEIRDQIKAVNGISPEDIAQGIPYVKTGKLQLGDEFLLSGMGNEQTSNVPDGWLRLMDTDDANFRGGIASGNLYVDDKSFLQGEVAIQGPVTMSDTTKFLGGTSEYNATHQPTQFPGPNGKNTIGGDTTIHGTLNALGPLTLNDGLHFENVAITNKKGFNIALNGSPMTIHGANGALLQEQNDSSMILKTQLKVPTIQTTSIMTSNASLDNDGNIYAKSKISVGIPPSDTQDYMLHVHGGMPNTFNASFQNQGVQVAFANNAGTGMEIRTDKTNTSNALSVYSAAGELLQIQNSGAISIGSSNAPATTETKINTPITRVKTYLDAWGDWDVNNKKYEKTLVIGGNSKKVVIGNSETSGNDYAVNLTPAKDVIVATNPTYVANKLNVATQPSDQYPYDSGIHTSHLLATRTIGAGLLNSTPRAYMNAQGEIYSATNTLSGSDSNLKQDIKPITKSEVNRVASLKPVSYELKANPSKRHFGFIAQDVEAVYPDLVSTAQDGNKALNYNEFVPLVVGNLQTLNKTIPTPTKLCLGETCVTEADLKLLKSYMS